MGIKIGLGALPYLFWATLSVGVSSSFLSADESDVVAWIILDGAATQIVNRAKHKNGRCCEFEYSTLPRIDDIPVTDIETLEIGRPDGKPGRAVILLESGAGFPLETSVPSMDAQDRVVAYLFESNWGRNYLIENENGEWELDGAWIAASTDVNCNELKEYWILYSTMFDQLGYVLLEETGDERHFVQILADCPNCGD